MGHLFQSLLVVLSLICSLALLHHRPLNNKLFYERHVMQNSKSQDISNEISLLLMAATSKNIPPKEISDTILAIDEKSTQKLANIRDLQGSWELIYSSLISQGYFPVIEICDFFGYTLSSQWGPVPLGTIKGTSTVLSDSPAVVEFAAETISFGPFTIPLSSKKSKSYAFIYIGKDIAVASNIASLIAGAQSLINRIPGEDRLHGPAAISPGSKRFALNLDFMKLQLSQPAYITHSATNLLIVRCKSLAYSNNSNKCKHEEAVLSMNKEPNDNNCFVLNVFVEWGQNLKTTKTDTSTELKEQLKPKATEPNSNTELLRGIKVQELCTSVMIAT
eukprot:gene2102-4107_t